VQVSPGVSPSRISQPSWSCGQRYFVVASFDHAIWVVKAGTCPTARMPSRCASAVSAPTQSAFTELQETIQLDVHDVPTEWRVTGRR